MIIMNHFVFMNHDLSYHFYFKLYIFKLCDVVLVISSTLSHSPTSPETLLLGLVSSCINP